MSVVIVASILMAIAAPAATAEDDPIVCRGRSESVVGTRIKPKKTCMKKSDWDLQEKNTQRQLQEINQRGNNPGRAEGRSATPQ